MVDRVRNALIQPLTDLSRWLEATNIKAIVVGGVAASCLGRPRFTKDIDVLAILHEQDWGMALETARDYGFLPRVDKPLEFASRTRVLLLRHAKSLIDVDVIIGGLPFEQATVEHGRVYEVSGASVRLPRVEDLLIMKAVAHRPQDIEDIEGLLEAHPEADIDSVRTWIRAFASALSMSDLIDDFERLLKRRTSKD